ncbi:unnamed protein product [Schistosoma mattheei]|uniref:Uncharacterized protein n=1 Tax=Schistosoma mattheei TaxID=31246 RepID=A0A183Q456_9TREM|nr:unnamed protein product [Schistosoma mattheei]
MSAYSSLLPGHAYRKLPGEERVDHCSASHVTYGGLNLHGVIEINMDYRLCDTYPAILAVPWEVTDELLVACAPHRSRGRIPVLSWLHPESKASLTRASQPLVGVQGRRSSDDKELVRQLRIANANANNLLIFDARPQVRCLTRVCVSSH